MEKMQSYLYIMILLLLIVLFVPLFVPLEQILSYEKFKIIVNPFYA